MGLDIFFHRFTSTSNDLETIINEDDEKARETLSNFFDKEYRKLSKLEFGSDAYNDAWTKFYKRLQKFTNYPRWYFEKLENPTKVEDAYLVSEKYVSQYCAQYNAYFRKVNFVYRYFQDRLEDEWCFVEKSDCEELIARCEKILASKDVELAQELLPTQEGFFFGSIEYDEWYFYDCKECIKQMKKLLKGWKDGERCYVYMSW